MVICAQCVGIGKITFLWWNIVWYWYGARTIVFSRVITCHIRAGLSDCINDFIEIIQSVSCACYLFVSECRESQSQVTRHSHICPSTSTLTFDRKKCKYVKAVHLCLWVGLEAVLQIRRQKFIMGTWSVRWWKQLSPLALGLLGFSSSSLAFCRMS
jgi:hypothetical protein